MGQVSRRELGKFMNLIDKYQPNNVELYSALNKFVYKNIDAKTKTIFDKTVDALFKSLDYPTEEWEMTDPKMLNNYKLVKDSIIEYCTTDIKDIPTVIDNVAYLNNISVEEVEKSMKSYMSSYGDTSKVMNAFIQYSENYQANILKSNLPETYIPIYSKAVIEKIKEMNENKKK